MKEILKLCSAQEARVLLSAFPALGEEVLSLAEADRRVVFEDILAPEDLPHWPKSVMDGYAVRAKETRNATTGVPAYFQIVGTVPMGDVYTGKIKPGQAVGISTGGVLPVGTDAVVMVEHTQLGAGDELQVYKALSPGDNVIRPGEDLTVGQVIVPQGRRLRPQDIGAMAAFGLTEVRVHRRPRVGILSTGNEIVPMEKVPQPGQVRCMNQHTLGSLARRMGADVYLGGIVPDVADDIRARMVKLVDRCDLVLVSGGSSVGTRDLTASVLEAMGATIVFHGINVRPGKPTILARLGDKPILGLPGVPVSAMVIFDVFVRPLLSRLAGEIVRDPWPARRRARLTRRVPSAAGREDYVRVRLVEGGELADPLFGGSAAISTLVLADGYFILPAPLDHLPEGHEVDVLLY